MSAKSQLLYQQHRWAESIGLAPDPRGYLETVESNLFQPLNEATRRAFEDGSGAELRDTRSRPAKMKALHSSSALAVNFFDRWVGTDTSLLAAALGLKSAIIAIQFEERFPTGLTGNPPNLDVALQLSDGHVVGIESKFSEWLARKSKRTIPFKPKYFPEGQGLWAKCSLPRTQQLAESISDGRRSFRHLDAPQLLKHALGLASRLGKRFSLFYVYLDWPGAESKAHAEEIRRFAALVDAALGFRAASYQDLFVSLDGKIGLDEGYASYLRTRYFGGAAALTD